MGCKLHNDKKDVIKMKDLKYGEIGIVLQGLGEGILVTKAKSNDGDIFFIELGNKNHEDGYKRNAETQVRILQPGELIEIT